MPFVISAMTRQEVQAYVAHLTQVDTTLNVYTQVLEGTVRAAVETVGAELFRIVPSPVGPTALIH